MGPLSLSLHVRLPLGRVQRVHSSSSSYPVPCSLSLVSQEFTISHALSVSVKMLLLLSVFFRRELLGSQMKPGSFCPGTLVCVTARHGLSRRGRCWGVTLLLRIMRHLLLLGRRSVGESMRNGGGLEVLAMALGFGVSLPLGSCGFLAWIRCGVLDPFAKILTNYLDNYYLIIPYLIILKYLSSFENFQ